MTTNEIKDLIASAIAGQGNQVDAGGKLAEILNALADAAGGGGDVKPIFLSAEPTTEMTTQAQLDAIGLTIDEFKAAARGERNAIVIKSLEDNGEVVEAFPITGSEYEESGEDGGIYRIECAYVEYSAQGAIQSIFGWHIQSDTIEGEIGVYIEHFEV